MLPTAPAKISASPTITPVGVFLRWRSRRPISHAMPPASTMRKMPSSSLPQSKPPPDAMCMPNAAPLFSIKRSWNQSGKTIIASSRCMWVLTHILRTWSAISSAITSRDTFLTVIVFGFRMHKDSARREQKQTCLLFAEPQPMFYKDSASWEQKQTCLLFAEPQPI